jgi:hypothetical protein
MPTAGASIASTVRAEAAITDGAAGRPSTVILLTAMMIVATADQVDQADHTAMVDHVVEKPMVGLTAVADQVVVDPTVVKRMADPVVVDRMVVAHLTAVEHRTVAKRTAVEHLTAVADILAATIGNQ